MTFASSLNSEIEALLRLLSYKNITFAIEQSILRSEMGGESKNWWPANYSRSEIWPVESDRLHTTWPN